MCSCLARGSASEVPPPEVVGPSPAGPQGEGGARSRTDAAEMDGSEDWRDAFAARIALLLLGLLALVPPWLIATVCEDVRQDGLVERIAVYLLWDVGTLAMVAWCVWRRQRFQDQPLHAWTRRYATCALISVIASASMSITYSHATCGGKTDLPLHVHLAYYVFTLANYTGQVIQCYLGLLKLDLLGRAWTARLARGGLSASVVFGLARSMASLLTVLEVWEDQNFMLLCLMAVAVLGVVVSVVAIVCGLLAAAQSAVRGARAGARMEARWIRLTAALLLTSLFTGLGYHVLEAWKPEWCGIVGTVDVLFNNATVLLLSGLAGPPELRHFAVETFRKINMYSKDDLQEFYEAFLVYLAEAQIKWVKCRYLRSLAASGANMVRCQAVPPAEAIIGSEGFPIFRGDLKGRFVLSHPWLSKSHPDPEGAKLKGLVEQLDVLHAADEDGVFIDYMSLPQHDSQDPELQQLETEKNWPKPGEHPAVRTLEEEVTFKRALGNMELLYSMAAVPVIVLPMDGHIEDGKEYIHRGWCFLEFCLAFSFGNIANDKFLCSVQKLCDQVRDLNADTVEGFRKAFKGTHFTQSGDENVVLNLFTNTIGKKSQSPFPAAAAAHV